MTDNTETKAKGPVLIEIEKVITSKNPKLLKKIPNFLIRYLKRIVHQNEINDFLKTHQDKIGLDFVAAAIEYFEVSYTVNGLENIGKGKYIFAANHPLGGLDGLVLMDTIGKIFPDLSRKYKTSGL